jgi:hypothetical protein
VKKAVAGKAHTSSLGLRGFFRYERDHPDYGRQNRMSNFGESCIRPLGERGCQYVIFSHGKKHTPLTTKPARIFNESSNIGSAFTVSPAPSTSSFGPTCCPPGCATVTRSVCMSLSSTVVGVVGVFLFGVGVFVVAGDMVAADHGASFDFSLFFFLFDFCLLEGGPSDVTLQLRASEGPPEGRAALRPDSCCFDVDGTGIGGIAE